MYHIIEVRNADLVLRSQTIGADEVHVGVALDQRQELRRRIHRLQFPLGGLGVDGDLAPAPHVEQDLDEHALSCHGHPSPLGVERDAGGAEHLRVLVLHHGEARDIRAGVLHPRPVQSKGNLK